MNLLDLPDLVVNTILSYLPFHERLRIGRVSTSFLDISNDLISKTKSLRINWNYAVVRHKSFTYPYHKLSPSDLDRILRHCASNLVRLQFEDEYRHWNDDKAREFGQVLYRFSFPKLEYLDLSHIQLEPAAFAEILRQSPQMRALVRKPLPSIRFPAFVAERLESTTFWNVTNRSLSSMLSRLPNLKSVDFDCFRADTRSFEVFLNNFPNLESIRLQIHDADSVDILFNELDSFWRLNNLKHLRILRWKKYQEDKIPISIDLRMIAVRFPNLICLELASIRCNEFDLADLARTLTQLQSIELGIKGAHGLEFDLAIRELANLSRLTKVKLGRNRITSTTFGTLVRSCPRLIYLRFLSIEDMGAGEIIDKLLRPFSGGPSRRVHIILDSRKENLSAAFLELKEDVCQKYLKLLWRKERIKLGVFVQNYERLC